jgi:hypothetical protein
MHGKIRCTRLTPKTLHENRRLLGMSISQLSKATGIPVQRLRWLEAGKVRFRAVTKAERESLRIILRMTGNGQPVKPPSAWEYTAEQERIDRIVAEATGRVSLILSEALRKIISEVRC